MYQITINKDDALTRVEAKFTQYLNLALLIQMIDELVEIEKKYPAHQLLIDFVEVIEVKVGFGEIKKIVAYLKANDTRQGVTAIVTGTNINRYFLVKIYTDLVGFFSPNEDKAFKQRDQAEQWLNSLL